MSTAIDFAAKELNARQEAVDAPQLKQTTQEQKTTIGLLVNDRPGVLVRIAQCFAPLGSKLRSQAVTHSCKRAGLTGVFGCTYRIAA